MSEIKRILAEVVRIDEKLAIEGADLIELVKIRGWQVVVQKGLYEVGDLAVYFSIDALLPEYPEFEFLRDRCYVAKSQEGSGFRIKTIKLRGELSQGMLMPLAEMEKYLTKKVKDGDDLTDTLKVKKYERVIPAALAGRARGNFPTWIPKTDEPRIQNWIRNFGAVEDHEWEVTLKYDGSSMTVYHNQKVASKDPVTLFEKIKRWFDVKFRKKTFRGPFGVCSRNLDLQETADNAFWKTVRTLDIESKLKAFHEQTGRNIALQGELCGPGIQGNRENLKDFEYFVFNAYDIDKQKYFSPYERGALVTELGLTPAKVYTIGKFTGYTSDDFLELADTGFDGKSLNHKIREGLVFKSMTDPNISFKAINNKFLLKEKD